MRNDFTAKAVFVIILIALIVMVMYGEDIAAAVSKAMAAQTGSMLDQLLR